MRVCVYGASSTELEQKYIDAVYELGKEMAARNMGLVFGGGAQGMMGAAARGVRDGGGSIIGVAPDFFDVDGVLFPDCTEFIYTKTMRERKQILEDSSDAFIITPGGFGTLDEFFEILTLKQLERHNKAIVVLNVAGYYDNLFDFVAQAMQEHFIKEACKQLYRLADTPKEALDYIESYKPEQLSIKKLKDIRGGMTYDYKGK